MSTGKTILVYLGRNANSAQDELNGLLELGITLTISSDPEEVALYLRSTRNISALIWIHGSTPDFKFENVIQKSRNFSQVRHVQLWTLARQLGPNHIERILRLHIFKFTLNSQNLSGWLPALKDALGIERHLPSVTQLVSLNPTTVRIKSYCRISKMNFESAKLTVESNLKTKQNDVHILMGPLSESLGQSSPRFKVTSVHSSNLYYKYEYRIELDPVFELDRPQLLNWTQAHQREWAAPKTKLLWITNHFSISREGAFDKSLISIYVESPEGLTHNVLERVSPRILLVDDWSGDTENILDSWLRKQRAHSVLCVLNDFKTKRGWTTLKCFYGEGLSVEFTEALRNFLKNRIFSAGINSKFLSRSSEFSLGTIEFPAILSEISYNHFVILSDSDFHTPSNFGLCDLDPSLQAQANLFGRVILSEYLSDHKKFRLFCEWMPSQSNLDELIPGFRQFVK